CCVPVVAPLIHPPKTQTLPSMATEEDSQRGLGMLGPMVQLAGHAPVGGESASAMVTVALEFPREYPLTDCSVSTTVSLPSAMLSAWGLMVIVAKVAPAGIYTLVAIES